MPKLPKFHYSVKVREERTRTEVHVCVRPTERWGCGTVTYECNRGREAGDGWCRVLTIDASSVCSSMLGLSRMLAFLDKTADFQAPDSICAALDAANCVQVGWDHLAGDWIRLDDPRFPKEGDASWMDKPYCYNGGSEQCTVHGIVRTTASLSPRTDTEAGQRAVLAAFMDAGATYAKRMEDWIMRGKPVEQISVQGAKTLPWRDQLAAILATAVAV